LETQKDPRDQLRVEISISRTTLRRAVMLGGALILFIGIGAALAVPVTFSDGTVLSAAQLNSNFANLEQRMAAAEKRLTDNGKYSIGANYCAATATSVTGNIGGYVAAKALCVTACGASPTAHMCVTEELLRSLQTGVTVPNGWFSAGTPTSSGSTQPDCEHWSSAESSNQGAASTVYGLLDSYCNTSQPILCCD
jgi:hypothetical protein